MGRARADGHPPHTMQIKAAGARPASSMNQVPWPIGATQRFVDPNKRNSMAFSRLDMMLMRRGVARVRPRTALSFRG
jgi:hypothetical protein